jgi:hypothetical protein
MLLTGIEGIVLKKLVVESVDQGQKPKSSAATRALDGTF